MFGFHCPLLLVTAQSAAPSPGTTGLVQQDLTARHLLLRSLLARRLLSVKP